MAAIGACMNIYKPLISDNYQFFMTSSLDKLEQFISQNYKNFEEEKFSLVTKERNLLGDITVIENSMLLVFSEKAKKQFCDIGSFITSKALNGYSLLIPQIIDALNYQDSCIEYFSGTKDIMNINKYSFYNEKLEGLQAFILPIKACPVFVTDKFIEKYKANNYNGIDFHLVYSN